MFSRRKKYEVTDPGYYNRLIFDQKKQVSKNKIDCYSWLELGRLFEARLIMTEEFAKKKFLIRHSFLFMLLLNTDSFFLLFSIKHLLLIEVFILFPLFSLIVLMYAGNTRYPMSGKRYFKKAIALDPGCGEAYQYLGEIFLRKNQKTKAWHCLEKAIQLNTKNRSKIKRTLKPLYEKEFNKFFEEQSEKENGKQKIIDDQLDKIKILRRQNTNLQKQINALNDKVEQVKWETGHHVKQIGKEMEQNASIMHQNFENRITILKQKTENEAREIAEQKFIKLTTEIMESRSELEKHSFATVSIRTKKIIGDQVWQIFSDQVKKYLITAEQVYTVLKKQKENSDYSLVGMELCKALETILNQILVRPFVKYINNHQVDFLRVNQIAEKNKKPIYFTYLAKVIDQINYPEIRSLTLGQYHFILNKTLKEDYALQEYANFLDKIHAESGISIGKDFLNNLAIITKQYRNTITHKSSMSQKQCEHLRQLIFIREDSSLRSLGKIKFLP